MGWGGPRSSEKIIFLNNYRSILQDFKQFCDVFFAFGTSKFL